MIPLKIDEIRAEAVRIERERVTEIRAMCNSQGCPELADAMVQEGTSLEAARKAVLESLYNRQPNVPHRPLEDSYYHQPASYGADGLDKRGAAFVDGFCQRAGLQV